MSQLSTLKQTLSSEAMREQFARALPKHLSPERFCRIAITALTRTPKLADCTQESLMRCLLDLSAFGIEPDGRRAHLIPFGNECTLVIDWKGLAELAMRSGLIAKLHADIVCDNDVFEFNLGEIQCHKIDFRKPRGNIYAAYALAQTKTGEVFVAVLSKEEIDGVMKRSQGYKAAMKYNKSHPWLSDYNEMAKKTAFRRLAKWLPLSAEFRDAQERDDDEPTVREVQDVRTASVPLLVKDSPARNEPQVNDSNPHNELSPLANLQMKLDAQRINAEDFLAAAEAGGLHVSPDAALVEYDESTILGLLASFDAIAEVVKGGSK